MDIIGNLYKKGPLSGGSSFHEVQAFSAFETDAYDGSPSLYLRGNLGWNQTNPAADQWLLTRQVTGENGSEMGAIPTTWQRAAPLANSTYPISIEPVWQIGGATGSIVPTVGASRRLDCYGNWVQNRDAVDTRLINQYLTNTGIAVLLNTEADAGGLPTIASGTACTDTDADGMPDLWELATFGNLSQTASGDANGNGYTNIEEYLNGPPPPPGAPRNLKVK